MKDKRKQRLIDLGAESLADALLELAIRSDTADDLIERMIAAPEENIQRFKKKLSSIKRSQRFIGWRESSGFAAELQALLKDLRAGVSDPSAGIKLVSFFYEADGTVLNKCDDSNGNIGDVYRIDAKDLFVEYATLCEDKEKVASIIFKLSQNDDYGVRNTLIDCAAECLPEAIIRFMIAKIQELAKCEEDGYKKRHDLLLIESLARQIKDAELFKQTRIASQEKLSVAAHIDISRVYLESGDVQTALLWLKKIPENETFQAYEKNQLLIEIYTELGDDKELAELLYKKFSSYRSIETLQELLDIIGIEKKDEVILKEVAAIIVNDQLSLVDTEFLISIGKIDEAEKYLLERAEQLNGRFYTGLLPLAKAMESEGRNFAVSIIYRSLLNSILERGYTKAYPHGIRYLKKLDKLAVSIPDWNNFNNHEEFKDHIYKTHSRKRSFWSKYK